MYKSTGFLAKEYSVTNETIPNWIKEGKFERVKKTKGGHYRVWVDEPIVIILYARVSSSKQKSERRKLRYFVSLVKQEELLRLRTDIASGFNQNRLGYKTFLELALNGNPLHLVATTSDRITRTCFQLIKWILELSGGRVELLEESDNTEPFDSTTLIAFITSFINSHYGNRRSAKLKRSAKRNHKSKDKDLP
ncbi:MAG: recombinase family protein [Pseudomonadota bacterium]